MVNSTQKKSIETKLKKLYELQTIDSKVDEIKKLRGSLPIEIKDLEAEVEKMQTNISDVNETIKALKKSISERKNEAKDAEALIQKYKEQQKNVRNNREFDSLSKEIEYQGLEIQLCEKRIKEYNAQIEENTQKLTTLEDKANDKQEDLEHKRIKLEKIINETQTEEQQLLETRENIKEEIPEKTLKTYEHIRAKVFDGRAVVKLERSACGGCYSIMPPQQEITISTSKEIITCEECGRLLVSPAIDSDEFYTEE